MKQHKKPERRTFTQDRFDILIKRQKEGKATFIELTELDDIVNRNTFYREKILDEMQGIDHIQNDQPGGEINYTKVKLNRTLWDVIKAYISHIYNINLLPVKGNLAKKALTFQL